MTFEGSDVSETSDIAVLVRDLRVGGVVLLPENGNYRNETVVHSALGDTIAGPTSVITGTSGAAQILLLSRALQQLASRPQPDLGAAETITATVAVASAPGSAPPQTEGVAEPQPFQLPIESRATASAPGATAEPSVALPLLIGLDWAGDDRSFASGIGGLTPMPSQMAIGAAWSTELASEVGHAMGQELAEIGVNLLLGPTLDVLDVPRPGNKGDLDTRTFGGDPYWVGQMGRAFIQGVQSGGGGAIVTAAKHFPGQGSSDRRPDDELATVQKPVEQLRQIELAPFAAVTAGGLDAPGTTAAMMTSHIRYRGFQGNIRQLTPPIGMAPELRGLMALSEFAQWRQSGGLLISDALGVPAVRRYYDPQLQKFPHRQVAQDAFLAGNDILYLSRFALTDDWKDQFIAIQETILFFQGKYRSDADFRNRVDTAVRRIIGLKQRLYGEDLGLGMAQPDPAGIDGRVGQLSTVTQAVARASLTLVYPGREELADRMPTSPLPDESILFITDARRVTECAGCEPYRLIAPEALEQIVLDLYGAAGTGQISAHNIDSMTYGDLARMLAVPAGEYPGYEAAIAKARWIVFAQLDYNPDEYPESAALRNFLARRSDSMRDKRLVVMAFNAPYYLDTTEISKLTAYYGIYSRTQPFLETAVRALFREFTPVGAPPVTITGINYELIRQLEPSAGQVITISPVGLAEEISGAIQVGSRLPLQTGVIVDRNGHPVPDGTPVEFLLRYPTEGLELAALQQTTTAGRASTTVDLDRTGVLWITAQAGEAKNSTRIELNIGGDKPGTIATVVPTSTPEPTPTETSTQKPTPTATVTAVPSPSPDARSRSGGRSAPTRVGMSVFFFALVGALAASGLAFNLGRQRMPGRDGLPMGLVPALWAIVAAWGAYLIYAVGWIPGADWLQANRKDWVAGIITLVSGSLTIPWSLRGRLRVPKFWNR